MIEGVTWNPKWTGDPKKYLKSKLKILIGDFRIQPTSEELKHLNTLKTQCAIDQAVLGIINKRWN